MNPKKQILLAEDDDIDAMTVERALKELKVANQLNRAHNGEEALVYVSVQVPRTLLSYRSPLETRST